MTNEAFKARPLIHRLEVAAAAYLGSASKAEQKGDLDAANWFRQHSRDVYEAVRLLHRMADLVGACRDPLTTVEREPK